MADEALFFFQLGHGAVVLVVVWAGVGVLDVADLHDFVFFFLGEGGAGEFVADECAAVAACDDECGGGDEEDEDDDPGDVVGDKFLHDVFF